ncbi:membrane protein [Stella humosa]|uniref:Membrane protein n=1 Tax=Stella humosa TaxID=94 RepID=A0A3N1MER2_9PROT|nr:YihY/virulence factor BrkB family protein [Stella humosa]ROQ01789.1 membrane protein [Stella humosa]BBK32175.1 hypothetical protein STHU_28090 [Stella humosa]
MKTQRPPARTPLKTHFAVLLLLGSLAATGIQQGRRQRLRRQAALRLSQLKAAASAIVPLPDPMVPVLRSEPPAVEPVAADPPRGGWTDLGARVYREIWDDRVLSVAAGVTFYALLAIFPTVAALVSLYGLVADPVKISQHLGQLYFFLPAGAVEVIGGQVSRITARPPETLGLTLAASLVVSLWSANAGMKALFDALNIVHGMRETRSFVGLTLQTLTFTFGAISFLLLAVAGVVVVPAVIGWIGLGGDAERLLNGMRWPALAIALVAGLVILYRWGPCRPTAPGPKSTGPSGRAYWPGILLGSLVAALAWIVFSMLFSWYVANFADYNQTYGSLGAAIGFMIWIWLSATLILVGGEIDAEIERRPPWRRPGD